MCQGYGAEGAESGYTAKAEALTPHLSLEGDICYHLE